MQNRILPISNDRTEITRVVNHLYEAIESVKSTQPAAVDVRQPSSSTGGGSVVVGATGISSVGGASGNGFQATVTNPTTAPVVSVGTTLSAGMVKSNGSGGIALATTGTDYVIPSGTVANVTGFSPATGKTLSVSNSLTLAGTDGSTLNIGAGGTLGTGAFAAAYALPTASASVLGGVKPDGTSILNSSGVISATAASVGALASGGTAANSSQLLGGTWAIPGAIGSTTKNTGAFTTLSATGQITSTVSTGTPPLSVASTTQVPNLNASLLQGNTWAAPGAIGGSTPGTAAFTTGTFAGGLTLGSYAAGSISSGGGSGLTLCGASGATYDLALVNPTLSAYYMTVAHGSNTPYFSNGISATTATLTGNATISTAGIDTLSLGSGHTISSNPGGPTTRIKMVVSGNTYYLLAATSP